MSIPLKLSIITPSLNHGRFIEKTILSVINQDYDNVEHIIIDGASKDNSIDVIRRYEKHIDYWVSEPDKDLRYALQKGFSRATGEILAWQNADDFYEPGVFGAVIHIFNEYPDVDLVYGNVFIVNDEDRRIDELRNSPLYFPIDLFGGLPFQNQAAFFRRSLWERIGGIKFYEINFDVDLIYRASKLANPFFLHRTIGNYRNHQDSISFSGKAQNLQKDTWVIRRRLLGRLRKLPKWIFIPNILLAKIRRYLFLIYQGDWDYVFWHLLRFTKFK